MQSSRQRDSLPPTTTTTTPSPGQGGSAKKPSRGATFEEGQKALTPSGGAPKPTAVLVAPGLGARLTNAKYAALFDLYGKYKKETKEAKQAQLLGELVQALTAWLAVHDGSKKHDQQRLPGAKQLLEQARAAQGGGSAPTSGGSEATVEPPKSEAPVETKPEVKADVPKPEAPKTEVPEVPEKKAEVPPPSDVPEPPKTEAPKTDTKVDETPKTEAPKDAPPTPEPPKVSDPWAEKIADPTVALTVSDLKKVSYDQLITYLDTRSRTIVEALRSESAFVAHAKGLGTDQFANIVVRIILRTPDQVVTKGAARSEAIRILTSQLRNAEVCENLLKNDAIVVIVPKDKLMTDLDEFKSLKGTYTFDGRPWDITRGLGGQNTAIAEENLLGEDVASEGTSRLGWHSQAWYEHSIANGTTENNEAGKVGPKKGDTGTREWKPDVYCNGYSTTNHEFFHTIHSYGLNKTDHAKIQSEYDAKKSQPRTTEWADGQRQLKAGGDSENYSSSTVYEYFAQTGCAFQGTNTGTDPYTGRDRNNGMSWVNTNEPELAKIYKKICADSELKNVNPRDAKKAEEEKKKKPKPEDTKPTTDAPKTGTPTTSPVPKDAPPTDGGVVAVVKPK